MRKLIPINTRHILDVFDATEVLKEYGITKAHSIIREWACGNKVVFKKGFQISEVYKDEPLDSDTVYAVIFELKPWVRVQD